MIKNLVFCISYKVGLLDENKILTLDENLDIFENMLCFNFLI